MNIIEGNAEYQRQIAATKDADDDAIDAALDFGDSICAMPVNTIGDLAAALDFYVFNTTERFASEPERELLERCRDAAKRLAAS